MTSAASVFNTVACYTSPAIARRTYQGPAARAEATPLSARLFGTWTLLASIVRAYAAYNIDDKGIYAVALSTYALALAHFTSESLLYKTMSFANGLAVPFSVASLTLVWMVTQSSHYTAG
ncbi:Ergosterol biosynthetic protein [Lachnellula hyalina]|uniref:Ergosterol biosynthetic protein n=1 Tax=Lachnellula hyalina TaxID=1316788 RepID=A0A8H8R1H3_9HELO|nr:Ergosterol biosynthetic protein [Lachnellula hyalina]TVY25695.1 Ergosterol biosynthetic protein [Lachnellula hyalina]